MPDFVAWASRQIVGVPVVVGRLLLWVSQLPSVADSGCPGLLLLDKALRTLERGSEEDRNPAFSTIVLSRTQFEPLLHSADARERQIAAYYVPWIQGDSEFVYRTLVNGLKNETTSALKSAFLNALRVSPEAIALLTIADTDYICSMLRHHERNVRIGAIKLLGEMPDDEQVVRGLQDHIGALDRKRMPTTPCTPS